MRFMNGSGGSEIRYLSITGFSDDGIEVGSAGSLTISSTELGILPDGNARGNSYGIYLSNAPGSQVFQSKVVNSAQTGLLISGSSNLAAIRQTMVSNSGASGLTIHADNVDVFDSTFSNNGQNAINVSGGHTDIWHNRIGFHTSGSTGNTQDGVYVSTTASNTSIKGNHIEGNHGNGISVDRTNGVDILYNLISSHKDIYTQSPRYGIHVNDSQWVILIH